MSHKIEIPVRHINGEPLNDQQRKYLEGFFTGLAAHGVIEIRPVWDE